MTSHPHDNFSSLAARSTDFSDDFSNAAKHDDGSDFGDGDTASQRSISLSSRPPSPPAAAHDDKRVSRPYTLDTDMSSEVDDDVGFGDRAHQREESYSPGTSAPPSVYDEKGVNEVYQAATTYPPDRKSVASLSSQSSRKARPESILVTLPEGQLVLGVALVDFNHVVGPTIEWSKGDIFQDEEVCRILPFLALPDGAHLSAEDYSYFHLVPSSPHPTTIFGISCNQQVASSLLQNKSADVTRSTVQKAVVVLVSKPLFGPIRDRLGVVTTALFMQRDFTETSILDQFEASLEPSLRSQLTESGLFMGTNLRELVHTFRQRTLILVKALLLQKRILFYGHPVEKLCTYQYSLVTLIPGLLQTLEDAGSPPLANRASTVSRPTSLKTSDRKSMMAYMGMPLDIFGKDAFFQPYLPLQQLDMLKESKSWLCGSTNSVVTHQKEVDMIINIETGILEFKDPELERLLYLTPADRKWMDEMVKDVNEGWIDESDPRAANNINFKGSDDYLRSNFDEYVSAVLATVRYQEFASKGEASGVLITAESGPATPWDDFNPLWIQEFKKSNACEVWQRASDPMLFDIVEPRHPCLEKPSVVADMGLRLQEGLQDLKLEQQLAPAREAVSRTFAAGSTNFFRAVGGVRERWAQRSVPSTPGMPSADSGDSVTDAPVEVTRADVDPAQTPASPTSPGSRPAAQSWGSFWNKGPRFSVPGRASTDQSAHSPSPSSATASSNPLAGLWGSRTSTSSVPEERVHNLDEDTRLTRVSPSPPTSPPARTFSPPGSTRSTSSAFSQQPSFELPEEDSVEFKSPLMAELAKSHSPPASDRDSVEGLGLGLGLGADTTSASSRLDALAAAPSQSAQATPTIPSFQPHVVSSPPLPSRSPSPSPSDDHLRGRLALDTDEISLGDNSARNSMASSVDPYGGVDEEISLDDDRRPTPAEEPQYFVPEPSPKATTTTALPPQPTRALSSDVKEDKYESDDDEEEEDAQPVPVKSQPAKESMVSRNRAMFEGYAM